ncbi:unnamed protein product [Paramecium pentaurelia]|uniref:P-loop containing nucleoside triphosphate hydrolase n=1 Tax=Paramecium pentaurelia TaxID=43138 RepID=A0A8S1T2D5_9CILI|nr:unnamed protein product [Paramecium pentaurelia]
MQNSDQKSVKIPNNKNLLQIKTKTSKKPFSFDKGNKNQKNNITQNQKGKTSEITIKFLNKQKKQQYSLFNNQKIEDVKMKHEQINPKQKVQLQCIKKKKVEYSPSPQNENGQSSQQKIKVDESYHQTSCILGQIAIFLGTPGVGKTFLMQKLFQTKIIEFQQYELKIDDNLSYNFVDTKGFDFENDYDEREIQIKHYQDLFYKYPQKIATLFIVVNFERTDLMKKKLQSIYKYFKKFQSQISIIVTDMHLSDNEYNSQIDLQNNFKVFNPYTILFVRKNIQKEELIEKLQKALIQVNFNHFFDLTDTIFEKENEDEIKNLQEQLKMRLCQ